MSVSVSDDQMSNIHDVTIAQYYAQWPGLQTPLLNPEAMMETLILINMFTHVDNTQHYCTLCRVITFRMYFELSQAWELRQV